jgi:hypothetical protein
VGGENSLTGWTKGERGGVGLDAKTSAITRRKVLKQAGLAAGAAFAAPMLVSTGTAFASTSGQNVPSAVCTKLVLNGSTAGGLGPCDYGDSPARPCPCHVGGYVGPVCDPQGSGRCICFLDTSGHPQCVDTSQSGNACLHTSDCPAGWKCVYTCLDGCPNGVGCCDNCTGNSAPASGASGKGLFCLPPCKKTGSAQLSGAARANMHRLAKAGG